MIDDKLYELQQAARRHPDPLAIWAVYALEYYINEAKKIAAYEITKLIHGEEEAKKSEEAAEALFGNGGNIDGIHIRGTVEIISDMITYCMNHDRSDSGIIKSIKKLIKYKEANL